MTEEKKSKQKITLLQQNFLPQEEMLEIARKRKNLNIGVPSEENPNENRIAITPLATELLVDNGHNVFIEKDAGKRANFSNHDFTEAGGTIVYTKEEVFQADTILKVSPFSKSEINLMHENQAVISALNIGTLSGDYIRSMMQKRVTALAFELYKD